MHICCRGHLLSSKKTSCSKENFATIWAIVTLNAPQRAKQQKTSTWVVDLHGDWHTAVPRVEGWRTEVPSALTGVFLQSACLSDASLWKISTAPAISNPPCAPAETPDNGYLLPVYGPQDKLVAVRYKCYPPFTLIGSHQRVCQRDGTWSGKVPICVEGDFDRNRSLPGIPFIHKRDVCKL